jgi:hypothetical protein
MRDGEQPRDGISYHHSAVALHDNLGEGLRGQLDRHVGVAAATHEERRDRRLVAVIELAERLGTRASRGEQFGIGQPRNHLDDKTRFHGSL